MNFIGNCKDFKNDSVILGIDENGVKMNFLNITGNLKVLGFLIVVLKKRISV